MTAGPERSYRHPWLGVEMRHLATLAAVARTSSFRQAAGELGYVQSAVSQQISALEQVVGAQLIERRRGQRVVSLTEAGELLLERGNRIIGELRAARIDIAALDRDGPPTVRLAIGVDVAPAVVDRVLENVTEALPEHRLRVTEVPGAALVAALEDGSVDLAVGAGTDGGSVESVPLADDPYVLLVEGGSAGPGHERLIVTESGVADPQLRAAMGPRLDRAFRVPVAAAVAPLVRAGAGVGVVPWSEAAAAEGLVTTGTLIAPSRRIVLSWLAARRRNPVIAAVRTVASAGVLRDVPADQAVALPRAA